jgi:hypothetical protein
MARSLCLWLEVQGAQHDVWSALSQQICHLY